MKLKFPGLTDEQYDLLYKDPKCFACGRLETINAVGSKRMVIDHDHKTGRLRGLLCHKCNMAISWAEDNAEALRRLAEYLERESPFPQVRVKVSADSHLGGVETA